MFARVFALLTLALLASASHLEARAQCSGDDALYCCALIEPINSPKAKEVIDLAGLANDPMNTGDFVGLTCFAYTEGQDCNARPACCLPGAFDEMINFGCTLRNN